VKADPLSVAGWLMKLGLGAMFLYAGWVKLGEPDLFAQEIANYHVFPAVAPYAASTLPGLEVVLALGLLAFGLRSLWTQAAALCAVVLMAGFTVAVTSVVVRGINIECGCFGGDSGPVNGLTIVRDVVLLAICCALLWISRRRALRAAQG